MNDRPAPSFGPREAQPLDLLTRHAVAQGWDFFADKLTGPDVDAARASTVELEADAIHLAADAHLIFSTIEGKRVLEWLCDITVRRPTWFFGVPDPQLYCAMREGQNGVLFSLLKLLASAERAPPPHREGT